MATIGSLSVKLGLVTVEWDQATEKAKKQAKDLQTAFNELGQGFSKAMNLWKELGPLMGAVSIVGLIAHTIELTAQVKDLSNSVGSWEGKLTYLDYSSGKPFTMLANIKIDLTADKNGYIMGYEYPKEPQANSKDTTYIMNNLLF